MKQIGFTGAGLFALESGFTVEPVGNNREPAVSGSHGRDLQWPALSAIPTGTNEPHKAIEPLVAMTLRVVWTLVAKLK